MQLAVFLAAAATHIGPGISWWAPAGMDNGELLCPRVSMAC